MLRTQKLGEADRIITLLTRAHGPGPRGRQGRAADHLALRRRGSSRSPTSTCSSPRAASLDVVTQAETLRPFARRIGADYERYTAGTVMLETAERLVVEDKEPALQQFLLLVGALRAMCDAGRAAAPGARLVPAALAGGRRLRARRSRPARGAASRARTARSTRRPAACSARPAGVPGSMSPATGDRRAPRRAAGRGLAGRRGQRAAAPQGGHRAGRGVPRSGTSSAG